MNEALVSALQAAAQDKGVQARRRIYQELLPALLYLPALENETGPTYVTFPNAHNQETFVAFTDPQQCERWSQDHPHVNAGLMQGTTEVFRAATQFKVAAVVINPGHPDSTELAPWEFSLLASGRIPASAPAAPAASAATASITTSIQKPSAEPSAEWTAQLKECLAARQGVMAGYLFEMPTDETGVALHVGVRVRAALDEAGVKEAMADLEQRTQSMENAPRLVPLTDPDFLRTVREKIKPFYLRS
ncbi:MAG: enhanced serine sensitivity protein SseB C-terminal domain-containing protein [Acidobacteria bacterium]|nr:enhanced serine sensitivity protein SseB C-terminal domain-containing protein [Acidobacteriota bacterium]